MNDRAYTVREIDELREVIRIKLLYGTYQKLRVPRYPKSFAIGELEAQVEDQIRTCMIAGHIAEDLISDEVEYFKRKFA